MRTTIVIMFLLSLASCRLGAGKTGGNKVPAPAPQPVVTSIINNWVPTSDIVVIEKLNLASLELNVIGLIDDVFLCDGEYGNSGEIFGVDQGEILITGEETQGVIQFGHSKYVGASDPECRNVSKEPYEYSITGETLELCMVNYDFCTTYELQI